MNEATKIAGIEGAEFFDIKSSHVDETFRIFVAAPVPQEPGKTYPALYFLDGNASFGTGLEAARMLAMGNEMPPAYVIGIGYAVDGFMQTMGKRSRDYTPTAGGELEAMTLGGMDPTGDCPPGGGPAFLRFLQEELKPAIEARYAVDPSDSLLGGVSLGGLFPSWVLLTAPETFQRYIIISPSIWWNGEEVWQWEEVCGAARSDIQAKVFVTAGALETQDAIQEQVAAMSELDGPMKEAAPAMLAAYEKHGYPRMAEITPVLVDKLKARNFPGLTIHCHNMPDETHMSVSPGAISRGLRYVFGHWKPAA